MKLLSLTPTIWTLDLEQTIRFYSDNLMFVCIKKSEEWAWAIMSHDDIEIMISLPNQHANFQKPVFTGTFYFKTDNVFELWNNLKSSVRIAYDLEEFEYGMKEFAVYDNNGYMLQFGEEI